MTKTGKTWVAITVVTLIGALIAAAGSQSGLRVGGVPVYALAVALTFTIQWAAFIPAYTRQTEHFYDLTGSATYISLTIFVLLTAQPLSPAAAVLALMVIAWAARLGSYLFLRVRRSGKDSRFDAIKPNFPRFLLTWTLQGLWVTATASGAWIGLTTGHAIAFTWVTLIGLLIWTTGFTLEITADQQKARFAANPANRGRYITSGLWSRSRHPNYFGEILLWLGVYVYVLPALTGWQHVAVISPIFITFLLTRVSGIPLLEKKAAEKWGDDPGYAAYKSTVPTLIPRLTTPKNSEKP